MGALSFSPSPITTTPVIDTEPSTWRMASTAAWSTASLSPKPILRAAAMAAASVTRTSSRARLRSGASPWARASIQHTSRSRLGPPLARSHFSPQGGWHPGPRRLTLAIGGPARSGVRGLRQSGPGAADPTRLAPRARCMSGAGRPGDAGGAVGDSHSHGHGPGHSHAPVPLAASPAGEDQALRAVKVSAAGLGLTAAVEFAFVAASGSVALLADGLHNLGDVFTTATLWVAFLVGRRQPDRGHTFGFARAEDVAGVLVVLAIAASAVVAAVESVAKLAGGVPPLRNPGWALAAALVGVAGNEAVAQYKLRVGRRINSLPLEADGHHSRVDGLASLAAAAGIAGAWAGWPAADPLAGLLLSAVIAWVLVGTTRDVLDRLLDRVDPEVIDQVERAAGSVAGVEAVHATRARWVGRSLHVLVHAEVNPDLPLRAAHDLGEQARHAIFHAVPGVAAVDLHLDPAGLAEHDSHGRTLHHRDQGSR